MKKVKAMNGYTIFETTNRDKKDGYEVGEFIVYFSADIRDCGRENSYPEFECGTLAEAVENIAGEFTGRAVEIVSRRYTFIDWEEVEEVAAKLAAGVAFDRYTGEEITGDRAEVIEEAQRLASEYVAKATEENREALDRFYSDNIDIIDMIIVPPTPAVAGCVKIDYFPAESVPYYSPNLQPEEYREMIETAKAANDWEAFRATRKAWKAWKEEAEAAINTAIREGNTPADSVAALVARIGYEEARKAVASYVNTVGDWDERLSRRVRAWAVSVPGALSREVAREVGFFQEAHSVHVDQLGAAFMNTKPEDFPTEAEAEAPKHNPTAPELPEAVTGAPDFEYWRDLRPEDFTPAILQRFAVRFGVFISHDNGKTGISSFNLLAGDHAHDYDGIVPAKIAGEIRETAGACSGDCPGCYAKAMTRYPEAVAHYRDNTIAVRVNPEAAVSAACLIAFGGNPSLLFRIHDSGDYAPSANAGINARYFAAWVRAAEEYPFIRFGSYTKEAETVEAFGLANLPGNFCLSCSPWEGHCAPIGDLPQFIYDNGTDPELDTVPHCPAVDRFGNRTGVTCAECKHCYTAKRGARRAVYAHDCEGKKSLVSNLIARGIITEEAYKREVAKRKAEREAKKAAKAAKG